MDKYDVEITETLQKTINIVAPSKEDAILRVKHLYNNEDIILDSSNHINTNFDILKDNCNKRSLNDFITDIKIFNEERDWR